MAGRRSSGVGLRLGVLAVVAVSLFAALFARLWYLQVLAGPGYQLAAERNQVRIVPEPAPRGRILDRNGRVLVDNRMSRVVSIERSRLAADDREVLLPRLATLVGTSTEVLAARLDDPRRSPVLPVPVAEDVGEEVVVAIRERPDLFDPELVHAQQVAVRSYPYGTLAAHVLGYVGEINDKELAEREARGYRLGEEIGKSGVELTAEDDLRGTAGLVKYEVDSKGRVLGVIGRREPRQGHDVQLTIDLDLQLVAEQALADGLAATRNRTDRQTGRRYEAPAGSVVVLDPRDGSVLAMASSPTYDPTEFVGGIPADRYAELTAEDSFFPLTNRAIQGEYAPGSTFKLITAAAALRAGVIDPSTTIVDGGSIRIGDRTFRNAGSRAYGRVAVARALTVSSDVFFYNLGRLFWEQRDRFGDGIQDTARQFGLGADTGIPLPFEHDGRVPDAEVKRALHEQNPAVWTEPRWFTGDNVNLSIGQGLLAVTPIQLANAYAAFANGATRYEPHLVQRVVRPDGREVRTVAPTAAGDVALDPAHRDVIRRGLEGVTATEGGTAYWVFHGFDHAAFPVAGKTGTAQVAGKHDTALFAAYGPTTDPRYAIAVVMEQSGFGSSAAAPVARRVFEVASGQAPPPTQDLARPPVIAVPPEAEVVE